MASEKGRTFGSRANLNNLKVQQASAAFQAAEQLKAAQELASKIGSVKLEMPVKVGGNGKLFGALSSKEIADAMKQHFGIEMDKKKIILNEPIKEIGERVVEVLPQQELCGCRDPDLQRDRSRLRLQQMYPEFRFGQLLRPARDRRYLELREFRI